MDGLNDDNEKLRLVSSRPRSESTLSDRTLLNMSDSDSDEKRRSGDLEKDGLVEQLPKVVTKDHATKDPYARAKILMWMFVNTLATVTIVSCLSLPPSTPNCISIRRSTLDASNHCANCHVSNHSNQCVLTILFFTRSSAIKPSSATNPSHNVKQPSQPSTSSSLRPPFTSSLAPLSPCSSLERFPS